MRGFLRFIEVSGGIMYAPYSPDCDLTEILVKHFIARFGKTPFIIHDKKRNIAAVYNGRDCIIIPFKDPELYLSEGEEEICRLWKEYYKSVNISSRPHEKQMKGSMPVRYWKYLPEKR